MDLAEIADCHEMILVKAERERIAYKEAEAKNKSKS